MSETETKTPDAKPETTAKPRASTTTNHSLDVGGTQLNYKAIGGWLHLFKDEKPAAEMFSVAYFVESETPRPLTFVFNGGPGAASAYLHVGALGPKRINFADDGKTPPPPAKLVDNQETWLTFTDLVFIDPIGTGFSRVLDGSDPADEKKSKSDRSKPYWETNKDLASLCEFIVRFLNTHGRWTSPIYIAGESYGGYRVARLARKLQEEHSVGLSGAILISPALEFTLLFGNDYDLLYWVDVFPSMAASAFHHDRARTTHETLREHRDAAAVFAKTRLLPALACGASMGEPERAAIYHEAADFLGVDPSTVARAEGRMSARKFVRTLKKEEGVVLGMYDASIEGVDPFPDRDNFEGPDPTLFGIGRVFTRSVNDHIRQTLEVEDPRDYVLLSFDVHQNWTFQNEGTMRHGTLSSTDDLRYGMALNSHMKVFLTHGIFDLVTPYHSADRLVDMMKLDPKLKAQLTLEHYHGGHMFYTWKESREKFTADIQAFYAKP